MATFVYCLEEDKFFQTRNVPGDGSCMFHSISYLMYGDLNHSLELRRECCDVIRLNKEFLKLFLLWSEAQINEHLDKMVNPTEPGTYLELSMISRLHRVSIWIYEPMSSNVIKKIWKDDHPTQNMILKLLYVNRGHYMALIESNAGELNMDNIPTGLRNEILNSLIVSEELSDDYSGNGSTQSNVVLPTVGRNDVSQVSNIIQAGNVNNNDIENIIIDDSEMDIDVEDTSINNDETQQKYIGRIRYIENRIVSHYLGTMKSQRCEFCGAYYFKSEGRKQDKIFTKCCMAGKFVLDYNFHIPPLIHALLDKSDNDSSHFRDNIRRYNAALAFASFGASVSAGCVPGRGPYVFKIQGITYHLSSNVRAVGDPQRKYAQLYFIDSELANQYRKDRNPHLSLVLISKLDELMRNVNIYAREFFNLREVEERETLRCLGTAHEPTEYSLWLLRRPNDDKNRYNLPSSNEVAAVFSTLDGCPPHFRDIEIHNRNGERIKLSICSSHTDPMTYPLFYPYGKGGWSFNLKSKVGNKVTMASYYSYLLSVRNEFSVFLHGGKLTQQYIDDAYCKIEGHRLNYYRLYQKNLRAEQYRGLHDYLKGRSERENFKIGKTVILPSSFAGSPRHMAQNFQDAMTMVSVYGKPDLFLTFTCNPKWPEIVENLEPYETASDRPDLVSRVFYEKLSAFINELTGSTSILGRVIAYTYVFEWQKRCLPHAHVLLILAAEDKIRTPEDVDTIVSAEIPDAINEPKLFKIIESNMIHGPCGDRNHHSPCMNEGICTKNYPKKFSDITIFNDNGFPRYRRRDDGKFILITRSNGTSLKVDNRDIVPYNPYLSARYNAHINVEVCSTIKAVKYLFKYIYKGHSCICMTLGAPQGPNNDNVYNHDEINEHVNARYVGPCEAFHRIYGYELHESSHCIYRLAVHLEDMQSVCFEEGTEEQVLMKESIRRTTLTEWFEINKKDPKARNYLYSEMPQHYVWDKQKRVWKQRMRTIKPVLGRMYNVNIREGERFYLRLLLLHKRGCTSFSDIRTVDGITYSTYREAAAAMNLLSDDSTWHNTMVEAVQYQMPYQLRELFATICVFCELSNPSVLWEKFVDPMIEDYTHKGDVREIAIEKCLFDLNDWFKVHGKDNASFGLSLPNVSMLEETIRQRVETMGEYNLAHERQLGLEMMNMSNPEQLFIIKTVMHKLYPEDVEWYRQSVSNGNPSSDYNCVLADCHLFLINAAAGTGKTWIYNTLIHLIRSKGDVVIALAFTGIAASLLIDGKTLHSAMKLPLSLDETSICGLRCNHPYAELLKKAKLIIIDEISMCPRLALDAINRFFRTDLMNLPEQPFGFKTILFGGDFMQTLPVVRHGSRVEIVSNTVIYSNDWSSVHTFHLHRNMRVRPQARDYADWILKIGQGILSREQNLENDFIEIPPRCLVKSNMLINSVFGSHLTIADLPHYKDKAILTPLNDDTFVLNEKILDILEGESKEYYSENGIADDEDSGNFTEISSEFLNSITPAGMPSHKLILKRGAIVILLRNLNTSKGLCNGTRLVITDMLRNVLKGEILTGTKAGTIVLIPRIVLYSGKEELPFNLKRKQFPIRLAFSITINKAQGQSYEKTGIYLPNPVFTHGQLYVAFSRARSFNDIVVAIDSFNEPTSNDLELQFTKNVVFQEMLKQN